MSKGSPEAAVLQYLTNENRPYSVNDLVQNLHKEHGKTAIQKGLDTLVQEGKVREKVYGKAKVYFIEQSTLSEASPDELKSMDNKLEEAEKIIKQYQDEIKEAQTELRGISGQLSTEAARELAQKLSKEVEALQDKYKMLSETKREVITTEERKRMRSNREKGIKEWKSRKRICMDMVDQILENCDMSKTALFEEMEVETDEDHGVKIPSA